MQRYLCVGYEPARALLARMVRETTFVRTMPGGLFMYAPEPLASELKALHGFVTDILLICERGTVDAQAVRQIGLKHALLDYVQHGKEPRPMDE